MDPIKILLVDDSKSARYALRLQLQRHGAQVDTADSAETALERIAQTPPDAVLMDHTMPGMNGFEALEIIKSDPATAHIPVVMCTSHDDPVYSDQAIKRGALCVITKAAAPERLHLVLDQIRSALTGAPGLITDLAPELTEERASTAATPTIAPPPAPPGPARDEVEGWMEHYLSQHLSKVIEPHLEGLTTQLRQVIAEQVEMAVDAMQPVAEPPAIELPPTPPAPNRAEVEEWVEHYLTAHLGAIVEPHLERLDAQLRQVIAEQVQLAVDTMPPPVAPSVEPAAPLIDPDVLRDDIIPSAVQRHFDAERDAILQMIQQTMQESQTARSNELEVVDTSEQTVDAKVAPQTTQGLDSESAAETILGDTQDALASLRRGLQLSYWIGAAALVVGIGAAAALYLLVG